MSKKMQFDREDYLKVNRKLSREEEIKTHGRPVRIGGVHKSKKVYDRKRRKADDKRHLPSSFPSGGRQAGGRGRNGFTAPLLSSPPSARTGANASARGSVVQ